MPRSALILCLALAMLAAGPADDPKPEPKPDAEPLAMTEPIACRAIRGYEDYDVLDPVEVTPDEKLLIYVRSLHHAYTFDDDQGQYRAHLTEDVNIRKKGRKKVLVGREKVVDLEFSSNSPPVNLYLGTALGLKNMPPGEYEADLILKDALHPGSTAEQTLSFRVLPRKSGTNPEKDDR